MAPGNPIPTATPALGYRDLLPVFKALPGAYLLLTPDLVIDAASDEYLAATLTTREQVLGRSIFDVFPDNPAFPEAHATRNLRASLAQVLATRQAHHMAPQHYDVPDPALPGGFVERHWLPTNRPVLDADGRVTHIIHAVVDITAQRLAEATLRESQAAEQAARADAEAQRQRLHDFMSAAPGIVLSLVGPQHVIEFANEGFRRQFGVPDPVGKPYLEAFPGAIDQYAQEYESTALYDHIYRTGEPYYVAEAPYYVNAADAGARELRYFTFSVQAARDGGGRITGIQSYAFDVTEQVLARQQVQQFNEELEARVAERTRQLADTQAQALAAAERRVQEREELYQVFKQTPAAIAITRGPEHRYAYVNPASEALFAGRELLGRTVAEALPEVAPLGLLAQLDHVYQTGTTFYGAEQLIPAVRPDAAPGQVHYFDFTYQAYRENGEVVGISTFAYEVTEQVLARQRERESEARFRTMADAAPNMVWAVHPDSTIRYINRAFLDFIGLDTEQQYIATGWRPYLHPDEFELTQRVLSEAIAQRRPYRLEHRMRRHDGQYRWLLAQGAPSYLADGELYGYVGSAIDITDLKQANEQLRRTNVDLDNFIYTASHDLKAPIANIEGLLHAIEHELPPAGRVGEVPAMLALMHGAVERFGRTIAHLTDISRLQQEHGQPASQVPLARVVREVQLDLAPLIAQTEAQVTILIPEGTTLRFSEKNLRSVVYNLFSNALKYHHPDRPPAVTITCLPQPAAQLVEVRDNGLGLEVGEDQEKLFGMFKRMHTHVEGTGVGLYMAKKMVENAGGRLEVESELGQGSTFRVYFPY